MNWLFAVGFVALIALGLSGVVLVFMMRRKRDVGPLPDGDYVVTIVGIRETPRGVETTFKVDEPVEARGRTVTVVREKLQ